ncbi:MAG: 50S ribosomal protein L15 [Myxococcales bacterium]|nr:MAG: 50S ribosomal protein L15 [Myxococcales bacterium]
MGLHNLVAPIGARKSPKRLGRGESSGHGKTSGRGHKGQKARKSGNVRIGFEGGQNPLARRLPKKGFTSCATKNEIVNLALLAERFEANSKIDPVALIAAGLLRNAQSRVKVLGVGEPKSGFQLHVHGISDSARKKIELSGGKIEILA